MKILCTTQLQLEHQTIAIKSQQIFAKLMKLQQHESTIIHTGSSHLHRDFYNSILCHGWSTQFNWLGFFIIQCSATAITQPGITYQSMMPGVKVSRYSWNVVPQYNYGAPSLCWQTMTYMNLVHSSLVVHCNYRLKFLMLNATRKIASYTIPSSYYRLACLCSITVMADSHTIPAISQNSTSTIVNPGSFLLYTHTHARQLQF